MSEYKLKDVQKDIEELTPFVEKMMGELNTVLEAAKEPNLTDREKTIFWYMMTQLLALLKKSVETLSYVPDSFKGSDDA